MSEPRYSEAVKITWLLVWRGVLLGLFLQAQLVLSAAFSENWLVPRSHCSLD